MRTTLLLLVAAAVSLFGCTAQNTPHLTVSTDSVPEGLMHDVLFNDLVSAPGGVGFTDQFIFPDIEERKLVKVDLLDSSVSDGIFNFRWFVQHDGQETVSYLVRCSRDTNGETDFMVTPEISNDSDVIKNAIKAVKIERLRNGVGQLTVSDTTALMGEPLATNNNPDGRSSCVYELSDTEAVALVFGTDGRLEKVGIYSKREEG